ncbi:MAG: hypothetical protein AAF235_00475 [Planctomycetota bacterium]
MGSVVEDTGLGGNGRVEPAEVFGGVLDNETDGARQQRPNQAFVDPRRESECGGNVVARCGVPGDGGVLARRRASGFD